MSELTPPHPVLEEYYPGAADRHSFVACLFDGAARTTTASAGCWTWARACCTAVRLLAARASAGDEAPRRRDRHRGRGQAGRR